MFSIEKVCLALLFAIKEALNYLQRHRTRLISKPDPPKYILNQPTLSRPCQCESYSSNMISSASHRKGQSLVDLIAPHPVSDRSQLVIDLPYKEITMITP